MEISKQDLIDIRPGVFDDLAFVFATWLKGLRYGNDWFRAIEEKAYYREYQKVIQKALNNNRITVACLKEDPSVVLGFAVHGNGVLHWVYVKSAWRNIGIAKSLVPKDTTTVSNLTAVGHNIATSKNLKFNPFVL